MKQNDGLMHQLSSAGLYPVVKSSLKRFVRFSYMYYQWLSIGVYLEPLTDDGTWADPFKISENNAIFFHAIDQNVELQEYMGLSTGRLDSDMRTSLDCTLFVDCLSISIFSTSALITALILFSFLRTVLFCLLYAKPGLVCMTYRY